MHDPFDPPEHDSGRPTPPANPLSDLSADLSADSSSEASAKEEASFEESANEDGSSYPWDTDPPEDGTRHRHDAFTARRKHEFLRALAKTGCIEDACRLTGVGRRTVYRHQEQDREFLQYCTLALRMSATPVELTAWSRAVEGVEQEFACGGQVHVRRRFDGGLLRLLLQASNPKKYGPRPGFKRKRLLKHERKQMEREIREEMRAGLVASNEEVRASLLKALAAYKKRQAAKRADTSAALGCGGADHEPGGEEPPRESM